MQKAHNQLSNKQLLAFLGMVIGMFMAILDIQIVASSLPIIAAGLSASNDELSWIQTSYLIAEVIVIPITGFIARLLSIRLAYFISTLGFTIMSILCAFAWNIESMIIFRSLQGFFGGAMIPTVFSTIFLIFPEEKRHVVTIIVGLVVTIAPTLGPTLGGYITDIFSWHFMFLLNVLPGIFVFFVVFSYGHFHDKPNYNLLQKFDYVGIIIMALTLGGLQYVLEEGNKKDWFDDNLIVILSIVVLLGFIILIVWELKYINPILDLSAFKNKNFTLGCIYSFILGLGLYNAVYLLPLFLFSVSGFNTIQIGFTMMFTGIAQFISAPIAGTLVKKGLDLRIVLGIGIVMFSLGCYLNSCLTPDSKTLELALPQFIRGIALMFCFIPINDIALGKISAEQIQNASGLYNLMRNLGGAIGIAMINNILNNKTKIATQYLKENISSTSDSAYNNIAIITEKFNGYVIDSQKFAYLLLNNNIKMNAFIIAINEVFIIISMLFILSAVLIPFTSVVKKKS